MKFRYLFITMILVLAACTSPPQKLKHIYNMDKMPADFDANHPKQSNMLRHGVYYNTAGVLKKLHGKYTNYKSNPTPSPTMDVPKETKDTKMQDVELMPIVIEIK
jgi:hypothetical protein